MDAVKKEGKVRPEEVMAIIGTDDPFKASASAIRMAIGRGSNSTIQKIINELRQEAAEKQKTGLSEKVPPASPEVFESIWTTAYNCAMSSVLDLLPVNRTSHFSKKSINPENDGHENKQIQRRTDHWLSAPSRGRNADQRDRPQTRLQ